MPVKRNSGNVDRDRDRPSWEQADMIQSTSEANGTRKHFTCVHGVVLVALDVLQVLLRGNQDARVASRQLLAGQMQVAHYGGSLSTDAAESPSNPELTASALLTAPKSQQSGPV